MSDTTSKVLRAALSSESPRKITLRQAIGFGVGDFYGGGQLTIIATYLLVIATTEGMEA